MKICLDVSPAVHGRAGLGRYVQGLAAALLALDERNEYMAFYNWVGRAKHALPFNPRRVITVPWSDKPWRFRVLLAHMARRPQMSQFPGIDLFHGTDNLLPYLPGVKRVFTLHDLAFRWYPETISRPNLWYLRWMMPRFLQEADHIIAISASSKADAVRLYGVAPEKVTVVHSGVSGDFRPVSLEGMDDLRQRYSLPGRYMLFVGTVEPRKNLVTVLRAMAALREEETLVPRLVIAGKRGWRSKSFYVQLKELGLESEVMFLGLVSDADLPALYSGAALVVFPSLYEGFGLPVLEAMACGAPVVCSDASSLPEVAGEAALCVPPTDVRAWKEAIHRVLIDPELRGYLIARGLARAREFTWERAARATLEVYEAVG